MSKAPKTPESLKTTHDDEGGWSEWLDKDDKRHRSDGPAVEYPNGTKMWYDHGRLHRDRGPAIECADGSEQWWKQGRHLTGKEVIELKERLATEATEKQALRATPTGKKNTLAL